MGRRERSRRVPSRNWRRRWPSCRAGGGPLLRRRCAAAAPRIRLHSNDTMSPRRAIRLGVALLLLAAGLPAQQQGPAVAEWAPDGKILIAANGRRGRFRLEGGA